LNGECCRCDEAEGEAKQAFSESNLHFKFWLGTEFRANAVLALSRFKQPTEAR
jgi:hypothetical protein